MSRAGQVGALLLVFVFAKLAVLGGHLPDWSPWTFIAYFWQDVLVVLLFAALDAAARAILAARTGGHRVTQTIYWIVVVYATINIPIGRALHTPLTWPMIRATGGPLIDSFLVYVTWTNVALMVATLLIAVVPMSWRNDIDARAGLKPSATSSVAIASALLVVALGPSASARVDTIGLDRNVLAALVTSGLPRVAASGSDRGLTSSGDWRESPFEQTRTEDLSRFRGIARGRNIVLVSLESTAAQYMPLYGGDDRVAPRFAALARNAIVFDRAYATYPESIKGLFSMLCSIFPVFDSTPDLYERVPCVSLATRLADNGYRTGLFHSGRFDYLGMPSVIRNRGYQTLEDAGDIGGNHNSSFGVDEPSAVTRMLRWIDATPRDQPFFLTYLPIAGHHPYETPERGPFPTDNELDRYRNALHYGDASLGALIDGIGQRGLEDRTMWVIVGDHGEAFGQHEGNYGHTFFLFDENVRVPFIVAAPGAIQQPTRVHKVASLVDLAPTVLDLAGIGPPAGYQGQTLLDDEARMALFFADYSLGLVGLRDGRWKFIHELGSDRSRLFDLESDPQETLDLSASHKAPVRWYRQNLLDWSATQKRLLLEGR